VREILESAKSHDLFAVPAIQLPMPSGEFQPVTTEGIHLGLTDSSLGCYFILSG